jgi:hypothetical protein
VSNQDASVNPELPFCYAYRFDDHHADGTIPNILAFREGRDWESRPHPDAREVRPLFTRSESEEIAALKAELAEAKQRIAVVEHVAMEFLGTVGEYQAMPCQSLQDRMFATIRRYRSRVVDYKPGDYAKLDQDA